MGKLSDLPAEELQALFQPQDAAKPPDPQRHMIYMRVGPQLAGVRVTMETASQVSVVWACIDVRAKALSASDWLVYEREGRKSRELQDDRISYLLNTRPNPEMTAQSFKRAIGIACDSWGNGYAEIERDMSNRPAALWPLAPDRVEMRRRPTGGLYYEVRNDDGTVVEIEPRDMYHVRGPSITGLIGDNLIARAAGSIALAMATHKFAEAYFGNGTQLGGIMEYPGELDDATHERLTKQWAKGHQGPNKAFKTAFIDAGMKYTPLDSDADKAQLVSARQQDIEDICRYWGVPPHKVQHLLRATNNNIEHQGLEFVRDCLRPIAREYEQEANYKLFGPRGPTRFVRIDLDWAAEGDFKSRMEGYQIARNNGVLNGNEIREAIGYDDMGPDGDKFIVQGAMIELKDVGVAYAEKPAAARAAVVAQDAMHAWAESIFSRAARRQENRRLDLESKGRADAAATARTDAVAYLEKELGEFEPHLTAWAGTDSAPALAKRGIETLTGAEPEHAASALIDELKELK